MKKNIFVFIISLLLFGCSNTNYIVGKYRLEANPRSFMEFQADGTVSWGGMGSTIYGKYKIKSNIITCDFGMGPGGGLQIEGDKLKGEDDGEVWMKEKK